MTSFATTPTTPTTRVFPNPSKHVNFTTGMVLGVDDLTQEFAYLSNLSQWQARDLLGYGTVCGLKVSSEGPKLYVSPGVALNPHGQLIKVNPAQCANLDAWLAGEKEKVQARKNDDTNSIHLYLTLCYRECQTDSLPIPGEPCRSDSGDDSSLMRPSRLQDDFLLDLLWEAPDQMEEDALRNFVVWLRQIQMVEGDSLTLDQFAQTIRDRFIHSETRMFVSNPSPDGVSIPSAALNEFLRTAFRIWTTELRPLVRGANANCVNPSQADCVLLAELELPLAGDAVRGWTVDTEHSVTINEAHRPFLLHLRMIQEWMLGEGLEAGVTSEPTRIVATSWRHGGNTQLEISVGGVSHKGVIVAFGKQSPNDGGFVQVRPGSLDFDTFQVFVELPDTASGVDFYTYRLIRPDHILPVTTTQVDADGLISTATLVTPGTQAGAAALLFSTAAYHYLENKKIIVVIKGDYVLDETGTRAIHTNPVGQPLSGRDGGRFESWARVGLLINVNTATKDELKTLPGIGSSKAQAIIDYRTGPPPSPFTQIDDLLAVPGIGPDVLNGIRPFITTTTP